MGLLLLRSTNRNDTVYATMRGGVEGLFYILYGKDDFSRHKALEGIKRELGDPEMLAVNTSLLDGRYLNLNQLMDICNAVPFLCSARLVIVEGLLECFEPKFGTGRSTSRSRAKHSSELKEWQNLSGYVKQMPSSTELVLVDGDINRKGRNPLLKPLAPLSKVMAFPYLQGNKLSEWIGKEVEQNNGTITPGAVNLLAWLIGGDLWAMASEIEKLLAYSSGGLITEDNVRKLTNYARETNVFALVDAILEGRRKVAQELLHRLLRDGMAPAYLLAMISRQLRLIVMANELGQRLFKSEVRNIFGPTSDYSLEKALMQAKKYTLERIKRTYHKLLEADMAIKTGEYDGDLVLDLLVVDLCQ